MRYLVTNQESLFKSENYECIGVKDSLDILDKKDSWGLDTETEGFDPFTKKLLLCQIGDGTDQFAIDCSTVRIEDYKDFLEKSGRTFLLHNAKFDLRFFFHHGIVIKDIYDSYLAEKLLYLGYPEGVHEYSLKACCEEYLGVLLDKSIRGEIHRGLTDDVVVYGCNDVRYLHQVRDMQMERLSKKGLLAAMEIENRFAPVLAYVEYSGITLDEKKWREKMSKDEEAARKAKDALDEWVVSHGDSRFVNKIVQGDLFLGFPNPTCNINWNSSKQVAKFLKSLGFNLLIKDKDTGEMKESVDAKVIESQAGISDVSGIYIAYKEANKIISTYGQNFIDMINPVDHRLHTQFSQLMKTGRMSSGGMDKDTGNENPNFQNIPSDEETRSCFVSEKGCKMICADYSGQESVVLVNYSQEPKLIEFYKSGFPDLHSYVAKLIFKDELKDIPLERVKKERPDLRSKSKSGEFAIAYGGNGDTISKNENISKEEGERVYSSYFKAFPKMKDYFKKVKDDAWRRGYVELSPVTGHKSYIYDWETLRKVKDMLDEGFWNVYREYKNMDFKEDISMTSPSMMNEVMEDFSKGTPISNLSKIYGVSEGSIYKIIAKRFFKRKGEIERSALNYPIQGTSAIITKIAGIKYYNHLIEDGLIFKIRIPNIVHDEIEVEAPDDIAEREASTLKKCMESAGDIFCKTVPLKADPEIGDHWIH